MTKEVTTIGKVTTEQIKQLSQAGIIPANTPAAQVQIFAQICREKGISPFQKHIYLIRYGNQYQALMGIDGFRYIAGMSGAHAGTEEATFDKGMTLDQCKSQKMKNPRTAKCTVHKVVAGLVVSFTHTVAWDEFKGGGKWKTMPFQMLAKCAEAFALKKAFPEHLSGLHIPEEKAAFTNAQNEEIKPEITPDQEKKSAEILQAEKENIATFQDFKELASKSMAIIEDCENSGMIAEHVTELKTYIKTKYNELKG